MSCLIRNSLRKVCDTSVAGIRKLWAFSEDKADVFRFEVEDIFVNQTIGNGAGNTKFFNIQIGFKIVSSDLSKEDFERLAMSELGFIWEDKNNDSGKKGVDVVMKATTLNWQSGTNAEDLNGVDVVFEGVSGVGVVSDLDYVWGDISLLEEIERRKYINEHKGVYLSGNSFHWYDEENEETVSLEGYTPKEIEEYDYNGKTFQEVFGELIKHPNYVGVEIVRAISDFDSGDDINDYMFKVKTNSSKSVSYPATECLATTLNYYGEHMELYVSVSDNSSPSSALPNFSKWIWGGQIKGTNESIDLWTEKTWGFDLHLFEGKNARHICTMAMANSMVALRNKTDVDGDINLQSEIYIYFDGFGETYDGVASLGYQFLPIVGGGMGDYLKYEHSITFVLGDNNTFKECFTKLFESFNIETKSRAESFGEYNLRIEEGENGRFPYYSFETGKDCKFVYCFSINEFSQYQTRMRFPFAMVNTSGKVAKYITKNVWPCYSNYESYYIASNCHQMSEKYYGADEPSKNCLGAYLKSEYAKGFKSKLKIKSVLSDNKCMYMNIAVPSDYVLQGGLDLSGIEVLIEGEYREEQLKLGDLNFIKLCIGVYYDGFDTLDPTDLSKFGSIGVIPISGDSAAKEKMTDYGIFGKRFMTCIDNKAWKTIPLKVDIFVADTPSGVVADIVNETMNGNVTTYSMNYINISSRKEISIKGVISGQNWQEM